MKKQLFFAFSAALLLVSCGKKPEATFTVSPSHDVYTGDNVSFASSAANSKSVEWNFGDGNRSIEASPTHSYTDAGVYEVTFTAFSGKKGNKKSDSSTDQIRVWNWSHKYVGEYVLVYKHYNGSPVTTGDEGGGVGTLSIETSGLLKGNEVEMWLQDVAFPVKATVSGTSMTFASQSFTQTDLVVSPAIVTTLITQVFATSGPVVIGSNGSLTFTYTVTTSATVNGIPAVGITYDTYTYVATKL